MHSLVMNHPFAGGNRRAGAAAAELCLHVNGASLDASDEVFEAVTLATASGGVQSEALAIWFRQRVRTPG
jgi:prophage maintenance system killer protein